MIAKLVNRFWFTVGFVGEITGFTKRFSETFTNMEYPTTIPKHAPSHQHVCHQMSLMVGMGVAFKVHPKLDNHGNSHHKILPSIYGDIGQGLGEFIMGP